MTINYYKSFQCAKIEFDSSNSMDELLADRLYELLRSWAFQSFDGFFLVFVNDDGYKKLEREYKELTHEILKHLSEEMRK